MNEQQYPAPGSQAPMPPQTMQPQHQDPAQPQTMQPHTMQPPHPIQPHPIQPQPMSHAPHAPNAPYSMQPMPHDQPLIPEKPKNQLGIVAMWFAIATLVGVPFLTTVSAAIMGFADGSQAFWTIVQGPLWYALPLPFISFVLGIVALFAKDRRKNAAVAAIVLSVLFIPLMLIYIIVAVYVLALVYPT